MIEKSAKDIVREIVKSNPFWEHFICIKGEIKKSTKSPTGLYIEMSDNNTIPVDPGKADIFPDGIRTYYGFLNYWDQAGFGDQKSGRIDKIHFDMGCLNFVFRIVEEDKLEGYSIKTRVKHKMDVFEHLQRIWCNKKKVKVGVICSETSCALADVECGLKLNDFLDSEHFYDLNQIEASCLNKDSLMGGLKEAEIGDYDVVIVSRGGTSKEDGYGILDDDDVKSFVANMTKLTICAVGHVSDSRSDHSFYDVYDFDAKTPSLAGVRLREWLLAFKTIPENLDGGQL